MKQNNFLKDNKDLIKEVEKIESLSEFEEFIRRKEIKLEGVSVKEAFNYVKKNKELNDDELSAVSGGKGKDKVRVVIPTITRIDPE